MRNRLVAGLLAATALLAPAGGLAAQPSPPAAPEGHGLFGLRHGHFDVPGWAIATVGGALFVLAATTLALRLRRRRR